MGMASYNTKSITNTGVVVPTINFTSTIVNYEGDTARVNSTVNKNDDVIDFDAELGDVHVATITNSLDVPITKVESKSFWDYLASAGKAIVNGAKVVGATLGNAVVSLVKGVVNLVESVGDVVLMALGVVCTVFTGLYDLGQLIGSAFTGEDFESATGSLWKKGIMPAVGYSWSDALFDAAYSENGILHGMDEYAWGPLKYGGTGFGIGEGVGYVAGIIVISIVTFGAGGVATAAAGTAGTGISATTASTALAATAKFGSSMQEGYNMLSDEEKMDDLSLLKLTGVSTAKAGVEAVAWYMTYGNGYEKIVTLDGTAGNVLTKAMVSTKDMTLPILGQTTVEVGKMGTLAAMQASKTYLNWGLDVAMGSEKTFGDASIEAVTAAGCSLLYNNPYTQQAFKSLGTSFEKSSSKVPEIRSEMFPDATDALKLDAATIQQEAYLGSMNFNMSHTFSNILDGLGTFTDNVISGHVLGVLDASLETQ